MKNRINVSLFKNVNKKEIAYILGLLWADGHITFANNATKTPIVKHTSKPDDNETFQLILKHSGNWNSFTTNNVGSFAKEKKKISINWVSCRELGEFLIDNQYREKYKSPNKILQKIPNDLKQYWFRGYFDGDGSVTIKNRGHHSVAFTGCNEQNWEFIISLFERIGIKNYRIRIVQSRGGSSSQIRITNKKDLIKFENYIYSDYDDYQMGLRRKRDQFKLL